MKRSEPIDFKCPRCFAEPGQRCQTSLRNLAQTHSARRAVWREAKKCETCGLAGSEFKADKEALKQRVKELREALESASGIGSGPYVQWTLIRQMTFAVLADFIRKETIKVLNDVENSL